MSEKCDSHDKCFDRVDDRVEALGAKMDAGFARIADQLTQGAILHERLFQKLDQRDKDHAELKSRMEKKILRLESSGRIDWAGQGVMLARGLIEKGLLLAGAMIWWAMQNGYGK